MGRKGKNGSDGSYTKRNNTLSVLRRYQCGMEEFKSKKDGYCVSHAPSIIHYESDLGNNAFEKPYHLDYKQKSLHETIRIPSLAIISNKEKKVNINSHADELWIRKCISSSLRDFLIEQMNLHSFSNDVFDLDRALRVSCSSRLVLDNDGDERKESSTYTPPTLASMAITEVAKNFHRYPRRELNGFLRLMPGFYSSVLLTLASFDNDNMLDDSNIESLVHPDLEYVCFNRKVTHNGIRKLLSHINLSAYNNASLENWESALDMEPYEINTLGPSSVFIFNSLLNLSFFEELGVQLKLKLLYLQNFRWEVPNTKCYSSPHNKMSLGKAFLGIRGDQNGFKYLQSLVLDHCHACLDVTYAGLELFARELRLKRSQYIGDALPKLKTIYVLGLEKLYRDNPIHIPSLSELLENNEKYKIQDLIDSYTDLDIKLHIL